MSLVVPAGVVAGQTLQVNIPDAPAVKGKGKTPPSKKKKPKRKSSDDEEEEEEDDDFVPGRDEEDYKPKFEETEEDSQPTMKRPRRSSAAKATDKFANEVTDDQFEKALMAQQKAADAKAAAAKLAKEERARQRYAQALLLAKAAAEQDKARDGNEEEEEEHEIENIIDVKKGPLGLVYEIKWKGTEDPEENTWEPEANLHPELVSDFKRDYPELIKKAEEGECEIDIVAPSVDERAAAEVAPAPADDNGDDLADLATV